MTRCKCFHLQQAQLWCSYSELLFGIPEEDLSSPVAYILNPLTAFDTLYQIVSLNC